MRKANVAGDIDGTLTEYRYDSAQPEKIGPLTWRGKLLLEQLNEAGYKVVLFTGRINETGSNSELALKVIQDWVDSNAIGHLISRIWPHPKPDIIAIVDDRAVRWRGDPELSFAEVKGNERYLETLRCP